MDIKIISIGVSLFVLRNRQYLIKFLLFLIILIFKKHAVQSNPGCGVTLNTPGLLWTVEKPFWIGQEIQSNTWNLFKLPGHEQLVSRNWLTMTNCSKILITKKYWDLKLVFHSTVLKSWVFFKIVKLIELLILNLSIWICHCGISCLGQTHKHYQINCLAL